MKNEALLEVNSLHISVGEKEILHGVDLTVGRDETHVLMGCLLYTSDAADE